MAAKISLEWTSKGKFIQTKISTASGSVKTIKTEEALWDNHDALNAAIMQGPDKGFKAYPMDDCVIIRPLVKVQAVAWDF
jgi:hypothetical protein